MAVMSTAVTEGPGLLSRCVVCNVHLPLRMPSPAERATDWSCVSCGTTYLAVMRNDCPKSWQEHVRPVTSGEPAAEADAPRPAAAETPRVEVYQPRGSSKTALPGRAGFLCPIETPISRHFDLELERQGEWPLAQRGVPFLETFTKPSSVPHCQRVVKRFVETFDRSSAHLSELFCSLQAGRSADLGAIEVITREGLVQAAEDLDVFVALGMSPPDGNYPGRHSLHVAMVAISIAATLGHDDRSLVELGMGCMLHDLGMLRVQDVNYHDSRVLGPTDFAEITKHPFHTFDLLEKHLDRVPRISRLVAYQMHERYNGSGYPRGRRGHQIHELARVAAVADVFVALTSPRPHRPAMLPYYALERLLRGVKEGLYDPNAVRGLLKTVSLFPVGSYVALSDGRAARVIRANGERYAQPLVEICGADISPTPVMVDLTETTDLKVVSAVPAPV